MTALELRKKLLLLESDMNRLTLHVECQRLREGAGWIGKIKATRQQIAPWALPLGALAAGALVFGFRRKSGFFRSAAKAASVLPVLMRVWRAVSSVKK